MLMGVLSECMVVFHVHPWCLRRPEEILWGRSCIEMVVSFHVCMLRSNLEPLERQPVLLVT